MGEKSERKKQFIIEKARGVFARKGYKAVTMKDIVEACEISRGGLYLYFGSTREIFEAVMAAENAEEDAEDVALTRAININAPASDMLAIFIKAQKKEVFRKRNNLTVASYEYFTEITGGGAGQEDLKGRFDTAVMIIERLIMSGVESGEFICDDPEGWARNLMYVIEGMKVSAHTMGVTESMFDREMLYVLGNLVVTEADAYAEPDEAEPEAAEAETAEAAQETAGSGEEAPEQTEEEASAGADQATAE
ncbi:MAG: TetR/AcrR family transcriptional regulator [Lachnospiraceae bacterium]|nr:TetR/AcrR family transcriptional regulator [Butyrivibrio sp.]MBQ6903763.1 TetR/AcrR family transcriptional regulator [Lachnospiraceae bacterium]